MTRARDNADKLNGGEIIKIDTDSISSCVNPLFVPILNQKISGLSVKNKKDECIFSIEKSGKIVQQYYPPVGSSSAGGPGVILLSNKGGFRVLKGPLLETTRDGGLTWNYCKSADDNLYSPPSVPDIPIPIEQSIKIEFKDTKARWKNVNGTAFVTYYPVNEGFVIDPFVKWGPDRDTTNQTSQYKFNSLIMPDELPDSKFPLGVFTGTNYPTSGEDITNVDLELSLDLNVIYTINGVSATYEFDSELFLFKFQHEETINETVEADCKYQVPENSPTPCADRVEILQFFESNVLEFGDGIGSVTLKMIGFAKTTEDLENEDYATFGFIPEQGENQSIIVGIYAFTPGPRWIEAEGGEYIPPDVALPIDPNKIIGETIDGTPVIYDDEINNRIHERVFMPTYANPKVIVCSSSNAETGQPSCCSKNINNSWLDCVEPGLPGYGTNFPTNTIWAVRLPFIVPDPPIDPPQYPKSEIEWNSTGSGDQLLVYDRSVSRYPGDFDIPLTDKKMASGSIINISLYTGQSWQESRPYSLEELQIPGQKMIYANTRPAGDSSHLCGSTNAVDDPDPTGKITCRQQIIAWPSCQVEDIPDI